MKPNLKESLKNQSANTLGQTPGENQRESKQSQEQKSGQQKNVPPLTDDNFNKIIDAFSKNPGNILLALLGVGAGYCIYTLYKEKEKLAEENVRLRGDFRSFKNEVRSEINGLKRGSKLRQSKKKIEDCFDVTDVQGYEIKTDEKPEAEKKFRNPFLA